MEPFNDDYAKTSSTDRGKKVQSRIEETLGSPRYGRKGEVGPEVGRTRPWRVRSSTRGQRVRSSTRGQKKRSMEAVDIFAVKSVPPLRGTHHQYPYLSILNPILLGHTGVVRRLKKTQCYRGKPTTLTIITGNTVSTPMTGVEMRDETSHSGPRLGIRRTRTEGNIVDTSRLPSRQPTSFPLRSQKERETGLDPAERWTLGKEVEGRHQGRRYPGW